MFLLPCYVANVIEYDTLCWVCCSSTKEVQGIYISQKSKLLALVGVSALRRPLQLPRVFLLPSENMPAGLITGTDPSWRCMPLHMAAQIKMSPAACLSNSLALCPGLSQELQPDLSIWCSQHGGRPVY